MPRFGRSRRGWLRRQGGYPQYTQRNVRRCTRRDGLRARARQAGATHDTALRTHAVDSRTLQEHAPNRAECAFRSQRSKSLVWNEKPLSRFVGGLETRGESHDQFHPDHCRRSLRGGRMGRRFIVHAGCGRAPGRPDAGIVCGLPHRRVDALEQWAPRHDQASASARRAMATCGPPTGRTAMQLRAATSPRLAGRTAAASRCARGFC